MSHLLDVNILLACAWSSHTKHAAALELAEWPGFS